MYIAKLFPKHFFQVQWKSFYVLLTLMIKAEKARASFVAKAGKASIVDTHLDVAVTERVKDTTPTINNNRPCMAKKAAEARRALTARTTDAAHVVPGGTRVLIARRPSRTLDNQARLHQLNTAVERAEDGATPV